MTTTPPNNRHAVDRLADIRAQIKVLKQREEALRAEVIASGDRVGDENEASITQFTVERFDLEALRRELGMVVLRPFMRQRVVTRLQIKGRTTTKTKRTNRAGLQAR